MFEIVKAGGIVMVPIILCSILAVAITLERLWTLRSQRVVPVELTDKVWQWVENRALSDKQIMALQQHSPLGRVLAAGQTMLRALPLAPLPRMISHPSSSRWL